DGTRVLVDRLWPRGVSKERAQLSLWLKEIAPSDELRKWAHGDDFTFDELRRRYVAELEGSPGPVEELLSLAGQGRVTLLYALRDEEENHAVVLRDFLLARG
ncbi:MAG TPA: DUF488 family protein, partial [Thermoanaerobaculia bacterium]|nr:DUF488 family protein [Thermoanaerobaculia bacterium]